MVRKCVGVSIGTGVSLYAVVCDVCSLTVCGGREGSTSVVSDVAPVREGLHATYPRDGYVERWHVRPDGVEFTVTFPTKPEGVGDLVVRLDVDTELEPAPATSPDEAL